MALAQAATFFFMGGALAPASFIFSSIFSQTRGTPRKQVGRASLRVVAREPWRREEMQPASQYNLYSSAARTQRKVSSPWVHPAGQSRWSQRKRCPSTCQTSGRRRGWGAGSWPPPPGLVLGWRWKEPPSPSRSPAGCPESTAKHSLILTNTDKKKGHKKKKYITEKITDLFF